MSKSLWEIVDGSKEAPAATEDAKVKQNFKSKQNQAYSIIALSISKDIQILSHAPMTLKRPGTYWKTNFPLFLSLN